MKNTFLTIVFTLFILNIIFLSCSAEGDLSDWDQVYDGPYDITIFNEVEYSAWHGTADLVAIPRALLSDGSFRDYPWVINGKIVNGKISVPLSAKEQELDSRYEEVSADGARIARIQIDFTVRSENIMASVRPARFTKTGDILDQREIYIFYSDRNVNKIEINNFIPWHIDEITTIALKAGWNYVEHIRTKSIVYDENLPEINNRPCYTADNFTYSIGIVTQDINKLLKMGYRWSLDRWT